MFTTFPTYSPFRTLRVTDPVQRGEDVYALQTALKACGSDPGALDGILGRQTGAAIRSAQQAFALEVDGYAGGRTQEALARELAVRASTTHGIAKGALRGQLEHESSWRLGNYSPARPDGSYDAGVAQNNTAETPPIDGFNVPWSIERLAQRVRRHYDLFAGLPPRRRWGLAQGSWNAPAYACFIAREEGAHNVTAGMTLKPGTTARKTLEAYIASVSTYLSV